MKSKIFALSIATLILWGSTTEPMGRFFTATGPKTASFAKWANRAQWAFLIGSTLVSSYKEYHVRAQGEDIIINDLDDASEDVTNRVRSVLKDPSLVVRYDSKLDDIGAGGVAFYFPLSGTKCMLVGNNICDGLLHHEYAHIQKKHKAQQICFEKIAPLALHAAVQIATRNVIPSIGTTLLKVPATWMYFKLTTIAGKFLSRSHEQQADDAVPNELAQEYADFAKANITFKHEKNLKKACGRINWFLTRLNHSHPMWEDRIEILEARAAQTKS